MSSVIETERVETPPDALAALVHAVAVARGEATGTVGTVSVEAARALPPEVVRRHLDVLLVQRLADRGLDVLQASGLLAALLPEVEAMVGFGDAEWKHKDVWKHTKQVVIQAIETVPVRWAALLHDVGKVKTRRITADGEVHFFGHAEVGASMFDRICRRIPFESPLREKVRFLILHHLRANQYDPAWTDSAVRRFDKEMGAELEDLLALSRADITTKRPERKRKGLRQIEALKERIEALRVEDAKVPPLPKGLGDAIIEAFSLAPGPRVGVLRRKLEAAVETGTLEPLREAEYYLAYLREVGID